MASPEEIARYKALRSERLGLGTPEAQAPTGQASQAADPSTMSYQDYRKARLGGAQNIRHYSQLPEEKQRFMEDDWGVLDALQVVARPGEATVSGLEGLYEGEDAGQIWDRVKTELGTPYGIEGSKEVLTKHGDFDDLTMEQIAERDGPIDPNQGMLGYAADYVKRAYEATDPIDLGSFAADVAIDPLWVVTPAKVVGAAGRIAKPLTKTLSPQSIKAIQALAYDNKIAAPLGRMFGGTDFHLNKAVRQGTITEGQALRIQDELAQIAGKDNIALDEILKLEGRAKDMGLDDLQRKAVAHAIEMGQGGPKFINNPVASHIKIGGRSQVIDGVATRVGYEEVALTPDMMTLAKEIREMTGTLHEKMTTAGMDVGYVEDYVHHTFPEGKRGWAQRWLMDKEAIDSVPGSGGKLGKAAFMHERKKGSTLGRLIGDGYMPEEDVIKATTKYWIEANRSLASHNLMKFVEENIGIPINVVTGKGKAGRQLIRAEDDLLKAKGAMEALPQGAERAKAFEKYEELRKIKQHLELKEANIPDQVRVARDKGMTFYTAKGRFVEGSTPQRNTGSMIKGLDDDGAMVMRELTDKEVEVMMGEGGKVFAMPKEVGEVMNRHFYAFSDHGKNELAKSFKRYNSWWKSYALLSPSFHIRNFYGGVFQNYVSGMGLGFKSDRAYKNAMLAANAAAGNPAKMEKTLRNIKLKGPLKGKTVWHLWEEARSRGVVDTTTYFSEGMQATRGTAKAMFSKQGRKALTAGEKARMVLPTTDNMLVQGSRAMGNGVENTLRFALYLNRREKGDSLMQAVKAVRRTHFDYKYGLTPFERGIRDNLMPFYSWLRFNIPFQLNGLYKQPHKYANIPRAVHALSGSETASEERYKPGYFRELGVFKMPTHEGADGWSKYFKPDFPFKDIMTIANIARPMTAILAGEEPNVDHLAEIGAEIMQNAGPIPKLFTERMTGFNFFQKRTIGHKEYDPFPSALIWLPDRVKSFMGGVHKNGKWTMHKNDLNAYETLNPLIGRIDRMFPGQQERTEEHANAVLSVMLGFKTYTHNVNKNRRNYMMQKKAEKQEERAKIRGQMKAAREMQMNSPYEGFEKETPLIQEQIMNLLQ